MKKEKNAVDEYKEIFVKLHKFQHKGADNLVMLLTRYIKGRADYMASYIELVAERAGVSTTGHITTTNKDVMLYVVKAMVQIDKGIEPRDKDINEAWEMFIEEYRSHRL